MNRVLWLLILATVNATMPVSATCSALGPPSHALILVSVARLQRWCFVCTHASVGVHVSWHDVHEISLEV